MQIGRIVEGEQTYTATGPILPASLGRSKTGRKTLSALYVEDDPAWVRIVEEQLNPNGGKLFQLTSVTSIKEAKAALRKEGPDFEFDVILLDLNLPDSRDSESFDQIQLHAGDIPIVILSGEGDPNVAIGLVEKGAQDYLLKDFAHTPEVLARSLFSAVERDRILKERNELQSQLIQAEKLESLGRIAAGVAHEVKNPLAIIQMGVAFLKSEIESGDTETLKKVCDSVQAASNRAVGIIGGMVDFARDDSVQLAPSDLREVVTRSLEFLNYEIQSAKVDVVSELPQDLSRVLLDNSKMQQVVMNLVRNSIQAMQEGGGSELRICIRSERHETARNSAGLKRWVEKRGAGEVVTLEIRDHGPGIPEDRLAQVFEPFFTTKPKGKGAGLGLSVVFHIVELHGALIRVANAANPVGLITRIHFFVPV